MKFLRHTFTKYSLFELLKYLPLAFIVHLLVSPSPGWAEMFRCYDQAGTQVLTDNPAQLADCIQLESSIVSSSQESHNIPQPASTTEVFPPTTSQPDSGKGDSLAAEEFHQGSPAKPDITIPLRKMGGSFIVQAVLNKERTARLIVDTGASMTVLSTQIAIDLGILGTTDNELLTVNTAGGSVQVNMNYLRSLNVGDSEAQHVAVAIHDLPDIPEHIEGLLGMSFLKHFLITLDAEHSELVLRPKPTP